MFMKSLLENYKAVFKKYTDFKGRATRREYWLFFLANFLAMIILTIAGNFITGFRFDFGEILARIYDLVVLLPSLAVCVRRLHDGGRSAWWLLLIAIPIVGWIILLVFLLLDSQPAENKYGPNPKSVTI